MLVSRAPGTIFRLSFVAKKQETAKLAQVSGIRCARGPLIGLSWGERLESCTEGSDFMKHVNEISSLSHDIRNMLASIAMSAEELEASNNPRVAVIGRRITRAVAECASFCTAAVKAQGATDWSPAEDDLCVASVISDVFQQVSAPQYPAVEFRTDCPQSLTAKLCRARLYRTLFNLVLNSCAALHAQRLGSVTVRARQRERTLVIDVEDNGPGIPRHSALPCAAFISADSSSSCEGFGIGLPTASTLARQMGGRLLLVETGPKGTLFRLEFVNCMWHADPNGQVLGIRANKSVGIAGKNQKLPRSLTKADHREKQGMVNV